MKVKEKAKSNPSSIIWLIVVCFIAVGLLLFCQFYFGDSGLNASRFAQNTKVNGVDVSGLNISEAEAKLSQDLIDNKESIVVTLKNGDKTWQLNGSDFEIVGNFSPVLENLLRNKNADNIFERKKIENEIKNNGLNVIVPYQDLYGGVDEKIDSIVSEINREPVEAKIVFNPQDKQMFSISQSENGVMVDRIALDEALNEAFGNGDNYVINIPFVEVSPKEALENTLDKITMRSSFSTDYSKSTENRKSNIKKALSSFNGMIVEPDQEVSFNATTGPRTAENGYKDAKIIFNGSYVSGKGGGVCQASTTLYNALIRADIDVLKVCHHTLPASYVPLSFDAMVSEGYADLVFKNNLDMPIYIKAYGDEKNAIVEIYGQPLDDGLEIKTRSELVKVIPHGGDKIITDNSGEYSNKVIYKGEYYRLKYPQEGYESRGYLQYFKDGVLVEEKEIRHDSYPAQNGIIVEGSGTLEEGMTLPASNVKYLSPQKVTKETTENAKRRFNII